MKQQTINLEKRFTDKGYLEIFIDGEWKLEHRIVVENFIKRKLKKEEKVHHDNFLKSDNRIENLTLFPTNKSHAHFHRQIKQFGNTRPRLAQIQALKLLMLLERHKHLKEVELTQ